MVYAIRELIFMTACSRQFVYFIVFLSLMLLLACTNYLQIYLNINPCPLCILQRMVMGLLGIVFLFGIALSAKRSWNLILSGSGFLIAILGAILSGRQVWLQHLPKNLSDNCDVGLSYMLKVMPLNDVIAKIYEGGATCAQVEWQFLQLSLAQWSLIGFVIFALFCLILNRIKTRRQL